MSEKWDSADYAIFGLVAGTMLIGAIAAIGGAISEARGHYKPPAFEPLPLPITQDLGEAHKLHGEGWDRIYIAAPQTAVVILLPDGRRVVETREEIERRAKK